MEVELLSPGQVDAVSDKIAVPGSRCTVQTTRNLIATLRQAWLETSRIKEERIAMWNTVQRLSAITEEIKAERDQLREEVSDLTEERDDARQEHRTALAACFQQANEIEQTLGKALGFPWYKDDQENFPGTDESNGVCVGPDTAETLAEMAVKQLTELRAEVVVLRIGLDALGQKEDQG